jgi:cytochrome c-type protein NapC
LPHGNALGYLVAKGRTGLRDIWAELTRDPDTIDWAAMREERGRFVYDSGCLSCHRALAEATASDAAAFLAHRAYFRGATSRTCVSCHPAVGHHRLGEALAVRGAALAGMPPRAQHEPEEDLP